MLTLKEAAELRYRLAYLSQVNDCIPVVRGDDALADAVVALDRSLFDLAVAAKTAITWPVQPGLFNREYERRLPQQPMTFDEHETLSGDLDDMRAVLGEIRERLARRGAAKLQRLAERAINRLAALQERLEKQRAPLKVVA